MDTQKEVKDIENRIESMLAQLDNQTAPSDKDQEAVYCLAMKYQKLTGHWYIRHRYTANKVENERGFE